MILRLRLGFNRGSSVEFAFVNDGLVFLLLQDDVNLHERHDIY